MLEIGRLCVKTVGRDAREYCVVIEIIDKTYVLIDGNTRRKKVNKSHIEPLSKTVDIKKGASTKDVITALEKLEIEIKVKGESRKSKPQNKKVDKSTIKKEDKKSTKK